MARTATARRPRGRRANAAPPRPQPAGAAGRAQAHRAPQPVPWIKRGLAALGVALALVTAVAIARSRMGAGPPATESPASVPLSVLRTADFHALAFSPENSDTVFFGHHNGVMRSADGGKTWGAVADGAAHDAVVVTEEDRIRVLWAEGQRMEVRRAQHRERARGWRFSGGRSGPHAGTGNGNRSDQCQRDT